jgi:hypothetical protein
MKKLLLLGLPLFALTACDKDVEDSAGEGLSEDELAAELWGEIDGWESWDAAEGWPALSISDDGTHGAFVTIVVNSVEAGGGGDGALIVKKGFDDAEGTTAKDGVTVMWKTDQYESESGWFWAKYSDDGTVALAGNPDGCTDCHSGGDDYQTYKTATPGTAE